jgi:hypothetical protein
MLQQTCVGLMMVFKWGTWHALVACLHTTCASACCCKAGSTASKATPLPCKTILPLVLTRQQLRKDINSWVAKYRRDEKFSGRPSYG